jgi:hypothetical protein
MPMTGHGQQPPSRTWFRTRAAAAMCPRHSNVAPRLILHSWCLRGRRGTAPATVAIWPQTRATSTATPHIGASESALMGVVRRLMPTALGSDSKRRPVMATRGVVLDGASQPAANACEPRTIDPPLADAADGVNRAPRLTPPAHTAPASLQRGALNSCARGDRSPVGERQPATDSLARGEFES